MDASKVQGELRPIWDEINIWKIYGLFNPGNPAEKLPAGWLRDRLVVFDYARFPAGLGGNQPLPPILDDCLQGRNTKDHPFPKDWFECSASRTPKGCGLACQYEIVRSTAVQHGQLELDYTFFIGCLKNLLHSGLWPHMNISAAHPVFTGGQWEGKGYHWNTLPIRDFELWEDFVLRIFGEMQRHFDISRWRFAVINEPNCLIHLPSGEIKKPGYQGTLEDYIHTLTSTIRAARQANSQVRFQLGNYVWSRVAPGEFNLDLYLKTLRGVADEGSLDIDAMRHLSFSFYETPYKKHDLFSFNKRIPEVESVVKETGLHHIPLKIDEYGIHPLVYTPFNETHHEPLKTTLFSASWHAKAIKAFLDNGIVSASPWASDLFTADLSLPYPTFYIYIFYGLLSGQLMEAPAKPTLDYMDYRRGQAVKQFNQRLSVRGEEVPEYTQKTERYSSLEAISTIDKNDTIWLLLIRHQSRLVSDKELTSQAKPVTVKVFLNNAPKARYRAWFAGLGTSSGLGLWDTEKNKITPLKWHSLGQPEVRGIRLDSPQNSVFLIRFDPSS